jgi:transposase
MILELHRQGVSVSAIARRVELDRKTVRRYIAQGLEPPAYGPRQLRISQLRAFEPYLGVRHRTGRIARFVARKENMAMRLSPWPWVSGQRHP